MNIGTRRYTAAKLHGEIQWLIQLIPAFKIYNNPWICICNKIGCITNVLTYITHLPGGGRTGRYIHSKCICYVDRKTFKSPKYIYQRAFAATASRKFNIIRVPKLLQFYRVAQCACTPAKRNKTSERKMLRLSYLGIDGGEKNSGAGMTDVIVLYSYRYNVKHTNLYFIYVLTLDFCA